MNAKRKVEIFTAGCPVCDEAVQQLKDALRDECEITIYDLNKGCETNECRDKAKAYGVKSVPAVAIDGRLASCCSGKGIDVEVVKTACGISG
jgi:glutaredoxin